MQKAQSGQESFPNPTPAVAELGREPGFLHLEGSVLQTYWLCCESVILCINTGLFTRYPCHPIKSLSIFAEYSGIKQNTCNIFLKVTYSIYRYLSFLMKIEVYKQDRNFPEQFGSKYNCTHSCRRPYFPTDKLSSF